MIKWHLKKRAKPESQASEAVNWEDENLWILNGRIWWVMIRNLVCVPDEISISRVDSSYKPLVEDLITRLVGIQSCSTKRKPQSDTVLKVFCGPRTHFLYQSSISKRQFERARLAEGPPNSSHIDRITNFGGDSVG